MKPDGVPRKSDQRPVAAVDKYLFGEPEILADRNSPAEAKAYARHNRRLHEERILAHQQRIQAELAAASARKPKLPVSDRHLRRLKARAA